MALRVLDDLERMQQYLKSPRLRDSRVQARAMGDPPADVLELVFNQSL